MKQYYSYMDAQNVAEYLKMHYPGLRFKVTPVALHGTCTDYRVDVTLEQVPNKILFSFSSEQEWKALIEAALKERGTTGW